MGFFGKIKEKLKKTKEAIAYKLNKLFTGGVLTDDFYDELEMALISSATPPKLKTNSKSS